MGGSGFELSAVAFFSSCLEETQPPGATDIPARLARVVDQLATHRPDNLDMGVGWTAAITGEAIVEMCKRWKIRPEGVADDACFARTGHGAGSIADEFGRVGVRFDPAKKMDRVGGWQYMKKEVGRRRQGRHAGAVHESWLRTSGRPHPAWRAITRGCARGTYSVNGSCCLLMKCSWRALAS
jgi:hypothetical protein